MKSLTKIILVGIFIMMISIPINTFADDITIPNWIKNAWYDKAEIGISDDEILDSIQFLIKEKMISVSDNHTKFLPNEEILPNWVKYPLMWFSQEKITQHEIITTLEYLIKHEIIKISIPIK